MLGGGGIVVGLGFKAPRLGRKKGRRGDVNVMERRDREEMVWW